MPVLYRAHPTKRPFDTLVVIPVDVFFDKGEHLAAVALLLMLGVEGLDLYTPEEPLRGGVVRRTAFGCVSASWRPQYRHYFSAA